MKINVYANSTAHDFERDVLRSMYIGIRNELKLPPEATFGFNKKNEKVNFTYGEKIEKADLHIFFGSWKPDRKNLHHIIRTAIAESGQPFICLETQLLGRKVFQRNTYQRVGINGFLNNSAIWGEDKNYPADRFNKLGLSYNGWNKARGDKIVIALQLPGDASLRNQNISDWTINTIQKIRNQTDRLIEVRTHPGVSDKGIDDYAELYKRFAFDNYTNVKFINGKQIPWEKQILDAHCVVSLTSGLSIDAVLNGIPVIAMDEGNFAYNISSNTIAEIERPHMENENNVKQWLYNLAYCQWTEEEMSNGTVFRHLRSRLQL